MEEKKPNILATSGPKKWVWITLGIIALCAVLGGCAVLTVAGGLFLLPARSADTVEDIPAIQTRPVLSATETSTALPGLPTPTGTRAPATPSRGTATQAPPLLDYEAEPYLGSIDLERGFLPDPYWVYVEPGGPIDTSDLGLDCGFTSSVPTFKFNLSGGASETFLRIFFTVPYDLDTTLVVHTPNNEWLCVDNSPYGSGKDPVIDIEYAPSGDYAVWAGAHQTEAYGPGKLFITGSRDITP